MDLTAIISELGGGLAAVVVAVLGVAVYGLWRRLQEVQDKRIEDQKEHTAQMISALDVLGDATRALEGRKNV